MVTVEGSAPDGYKVPSNSSSTPIANGQNFTGEWFAVHAHDSITVAVKTDQNGYYEVQFSVDQTNVDSTLTRQYRTDRVSPPHRFTCTRGFIRVVFYNNSGSDQTFFRLQTLVGSKQPLNIPIDAVLAQDYDAIAVRASDFADEVRRGLRQGVTPIDKFGHDEDLDQADGQVTVWNAGVRLTPMTSAGTYTVTYNNSTDGLGTTGALSIEITHIDENENEVTETHTLGNTGSDVTSFTGYGINRCQVASAGSARKNTSAITITATTGGTVQALIPALHSITHQVFYFVPKNHTAIIQVTCTSQRQSAADPKVNFTAFIKDYNSNVDKERFQILVDTGVNVLIEPRHTIVVQTGDHRALIEMTAQTDKDDTYAGAWMDGALYRNVDG